MKYIICIILSIFVFSLSGCNFFEDIANIYTVKSTTDINEYGKFPALQGKHRIENYIDIILPEKIEDFFRTLYIILDIAKNHI